MPDNLERVLQTAEAGFSQQHAELIAGQSQQMLEVQTQTATGTGHIAETLSVDRRFRLVFVRCHFSGGAGTSALSISVASGAGAAFDTKLFTILQAGTGSDVNFRVSADELSEPSAWSFQAGDAIRVNWTNPDAGNMTWGLEVGLALAS